MFECTKKSINELLNYNLDDYFMREIKSGTLMSNVRIKDRVFFKTLSPQGQELYIFVYQKLISSRDFSNQGAPVLHFSFCEDFIRLMEYKSRFLCALLPSSIFFDFEVDGIKRQIFKSYPLTLCPKCCDIYRQKIQNKSQDKSHDKALDNLIKMYEHA